MNTLDEIRNQVEALRERVNAGSASAIDSIVLHLFDHVDTQSTPGPANGGSGPPTPEPPTNAPMDPADVVPDRSEQGEFV